MMNTNLPEVTTPPYIYHCCFTGKTLWEEKFTVEENCTIGDITFMNMKICGRRNFRIHREIKVSEKYLILDILLKFDSLEKIRIKSPKSKYILVRPGKGVITSLGIEAKSRPKKYKKVRHAIGNISKKDLSMIIKDFDKLPYDRVQDSYEEQEF